MFVPSMRDQIEGSHKMPQSFSKAWALKPLRSGLGYKRSDSEQCDREAKIAQTGSWLSQALTKGHFSFAPIIPRLTPHRPYAGRYCAGLDSSTSTSQMFRVKSRLTTGLTGAIGSIGLVKESPTNR